MLTYSLNRLLQLVVTTLGVVSLVFFTLRLIPVTQPPQWRAKPSRVKRSNDFESRWV